MIIFIKCSLHITFLSISFQIDNILKILLLSVYLPNSRIFRFCLLSMVKKLKVNCIKILAHQPCFWIMFMYDFRMCLRVFTSKNYLRYLANHRLLTRYSGTSHVHMCVIHNIVKPSIIIYDNIMLFGSGRRSYFLDFRVAGMGDYWPLTRYKRLYVVLTWANHIHFYNVGKHETVIQQYYTIIKSNIKILYRINIRY